MQVLKYCKFSNNFAISADGQNGKFSFLSYSVIFINYWWFTLINDNPSFWNRLRALTGSLLNVLGFKSSLLEFPVYSTYTSILHLIAWPCRAFYQESRDSRNICSVISLPGTIEAVGAISREKGAGVACRWLTLMFSVSLIRLHTEINDIQKTEHIRR